MKTVLPFSMEDAEVDSESTLEKCPVITLSLMLEENGRHCELVVFLE